MQLVNLIIELKNHNIDYTGKIGSNRYLFTDGYINFIITKDKYRYSTNLSYVDSYLRKWQDEY